MKRFDSRPYSIADIIEWHANGLLDLSPSYQRRSVWKEKAKSYLIDSILRGRPIPKVLLTQEIRGGKTARIVVDGQQRLRTILDYVQDAFRVSKAHNEEFSCLFSELPDDIQDAIRTYEISCDLLFGATYEDILDIFTRINAYTVPLNQQERLNAEFVGYFKQAAYKIGYKYAQHWVASGILTESKVARMGEAELASDLLVAMLFGAQSSKSIPSYYKKHEDEIGPLKNSQEKFDRVMSVLGQIYPSQDILYSEWKKSPLYHTLFCTITHGIYGVAGIIADRPKVTEKYLTRFRQRLDEIGLLFEKPPETLSKAQAIFVDASRRRTADTKSRQARIVYVCKELIRTQA